MNHKPCRSATVLAALLFLCGCATPGLKAPSDGSAPGIETLVKSKLSWDGNPLPAYPQGQPEITLLRITIPPKTRLAPHRHPVINAGVLLSGQLTVITDTGKTLHLNAGDPIVEVVNTLHYGINPGQVPAEILVFYAGTTDQPITLIENP